MAGGKEPSLTYILLIIGAIVGIVLIYKYYPAENAQMVIVTDLDEIANLNSGTFDSDCTISFSDNSALIGEQITTTINSGSTIQCYVYVKKDQDSWMLKALVNTGNKGTYIETGTFKTPGLYAFRTKCGVCLSNQEVITIG